MSSYSWAKFIQRFFKRFFKTFQNFAQDFQIVTPQFAPTFKIVKTHDSFEGEYFLRNKTFQKCHAQKKLIRNWKTSVSPHTLSKNKGFHQSVSKIPWICCFWGGEDVIKMWSKCLRMVIESQKRARLRLYQWIDDIQKFAIERIYSRSSF